MADTTGKDLFIDKSKLNVISSQQRITFDGYLRSHIKSLDVLCAVPLDLINLCYNFFELNILSMVEYDSINLMKKVVDVNALHKLACVLYDNSEFYVAYLILNILIHSNNSNIAKYHNLLGMVHQDWRSSMQQSAKHFEIAISMKPKSHIYKWNYGLLLIDHAKYRLALKQFVAASDLDQNEAEYFKKIAACYQLLKDYENATKNYLKCIELKQDVSKYYICFARYLHEEIGELAESEKFYKLCIEIEQKSIENNEKNKDILKLSEYYIEYAELLKKLKKYEQVSETYAECIRLNEDEENARYYYLYARFFRDDFRDYKQSEIYYKKCLEIDANYGGLNGSYGHLLYLMGRYQEAKKYLFIARELDDNNIWTFYYLGLYFKKIQNENECKISLQRALEMFKINCQNNYRNANILRESIKSHLDKTKIVDQDNMEFHDRFETIINEYIQHLEIKNEIKSLCEEY